MRKIKKLQKLVDDLTIRVGDLETHVSELEAELDKIKAERDGDVVSNRLQEGIDSILGYQWPPVKGGKK